MPLIQLLIVLFILFRTEDDLHKFQQNSYRFNRYLRWRFTVRSRIFRPHELLFALGFGLTLLSNPYLKVLGVVMMLIDVYFFWLIKTAYPVKKKLVYTSRIKRLKFTTTLLLALLAMMGFYFENTIYIVFVSYYISFIYVFIGAVINAPIEYAINQHYYNDAQETLRKAPNLTVIGITGSYGKTSTKNVLNQMLSKNFNTLMTPESFNTKMGLTRTIRQWLKPTHQILIAEMGAKETGDIKELCDFVKPTMGIITSIGPQHLETFKTLENVIHTKGELFASIPAGGSIFLNCDDENILKLPTRTDVKTYRYAVDSKNALDHDVHFTLESLKINSSGSTFDLIWAPDGLTSKDSIVRISLTTKLLGKHNLSNIVAGCAVAISMGVSLQRLQNLVQAIEPIEHRLSYRRIADQYTLLDDAFNSNPVGSSMALEVLKAFEGNKKIIITPGMIELGETTEHYNQIFGEKIADACDEVILVGAKLTEPIQRGLKSKAYPERNIHIVKSIHEAYERLSSLVAYNDVVLIENDLPDSYNEAL